MNDEDTTSRPLTVSVIMAVRNEALHLPKTLAALALQTLPDTDWELIVAVGPSEDETAELLQSAQERFRGLPRLKRLENPQGSAASGLNLALAVAEGEYVVRIDGHCEVEPDYLEVLLRRLREGLYACVGGPQRTEGRGPWGRAYACAARSLVGNGGADYRRARKSTVTDTVFLGAWPRALLLEAGGFDESLERNQDDELAMRLRGRGGLIYLDLEARSAYSPRESLGGILRQYFDYGFWKPRVLRRHPGALSPRHLGPPLLFLFSIATIMLVVTTLSWGPLLFLLAWIFVAFLAILRELEEATPAHAIRATILVILMPLAYGLGFLLGTPAAFVSRPQLLAREERPA